MTPDRFNHAVAACAAAVLFAASAQAQVVEQPSRDGKLYSTEKRSTVQESFDKAFQPYPQAYGGNEAAHPNDKLFSQLFRRDPRLVGGYQLTRNLAIEGTYVRLLDRGFHLVDTFAPEEPENVLDFSNFSSSVALKYSLPLSDKLSAYGKAGVSHSVMTPHRNAVALDTEFGEPGAVRRKDVDTGVFVGVGAQYKVNDKATLDVQQGSYGNTSRWGGAANSSGVRANLKVGF